MGRLQASSGRSEIFHCPIAAFWTLTAGRVEGFQISALAALCEVLIEEEYPTRLT
jgi:hypothetical protein